MIKNCQLYNYEKINHIIYTVCEPIILTYDLYTYNSTHIKEQILNISS